MFPSTPFLLSPLFFLLVLHHATSFSASGPHIADVNILLPPKMTHPVEYRLQGTDGCFKWSWDHHDILSVLPEFNTSSRCSTSARLRSIAPYGGRKETAVYATDLNSGMMIRCKVYVDTISRIQIFHNSVKLDLDGLATLRVRAFDSEDNVFSSLVGLQFMWKLMPETHGLSHSLVHVPLKDSPLSDCSGFCGDLDIQVKLEESGVFSDFYVVKGTEIGHEIVSVSLLEPSVGHYVDNIALTVAEAMSLDPPSPVHVLIGAVVRYTLKVIRSNIPHVVSLPSPFHQWSVLNSSVAHVDRAMGTVHASNLGVTAVAVEDTRVVGHMQISSLHVVLPDNLLLFMSPLSSSGDYIEGSEPIPSVSRWYVVAGRLYLILVKVFSPGLGAQEIFITESDEIGLYGNRDEFWTILPLSEGVTTKRNYRILDAKSYGLGKLTASLAYHTGHDVKKEVLKVVQEVMVCDQVKFLMEGDSSFSDKIFLPWVPGVYQELELRARGGCSMSSSDYKWFSSDMTTASVSVSGIVQAKKPGKATIRAVSIFDPLNYDEVVIEVSVPHSMVLLSNFPVETPVGSHLQASVTLKASTGAYFYACDAFRSFIRWKTESDSFIIVNTTTEVFAADKKEAVELYSISYGPPCSWTNIYAASSGRTVVHATLNQLSDHTGRESIALKASSSIAAFLPLIVHQASDGNQFGGYWFDWVHAESQNQLSSLDDLYLVPGTHLDVMLRGGPERWGNDVEFIENVEVLAERDALVKDKIGIHQMSTSYGNPYRIRCERLGTFKLIFRRGNLMGEGHHLPVVSEVQLMLMCGFPSSIIIIADEALNAPLAIQSAALADRLPGRIRASPIKVANGRRIRVSAVGLSDSGKAFANSSSLFLSWELAECEGLALLDDTGSSAVYSSWERFLILQNTSGVCIVRCTAVSFDSLGHSAFATMFETSKKTLTDAIQLQLVSSLRVSPEFSLLFFSPEARLNISITGGSCFLDTLVNDTHIVEVIHQIPDYDCSQLTLAPKKLGSALVKVQDIGLAPPLSASSIVQVAEMDWIKILSGEHISIEKGSIQSINFLVGIADGRTFDPSQYVYMKISIHVEEDIVDVVDSHDFPLVAARYVRGPNFMLQGTHLGVTTIYLSAIQHSGHEIVSHPVKVEVYDPPRIHPGDIFLVPGASYVLTVRGGPKIGSHIQYSSMDDQTAQIHKFSGRLLAISSGNSTLVATIYGGGDIMLCRAYGIVKVGIPSSAVLNVQSEQVAVDRRMPIYPSLSEGNLFSFYELCYNFKWSVEDKDILDFHGAKHTRGTGNSSLKAFRPTDSLNELNFIQVLRGISAGKTNVAVSFSCSYKNSTSVSKSMFYTASISLSVVPDLPLALGSPITWILPSYYTSSDLLPLSSHAYSKGGSLSDKGIAYSLLGQGKRNIDEVHDDDVYIDGAKIITKESGNVACILAKDKATGRTEVASCVRVSELDQIRMTDEIPVHMVALGAESDLPIRYHDILGNPFHEAHNITLFEVETNYPDIVSIDEYDGHGNICLRAKSEGLALVQASFVNNPRKAVYAVISVGPQLFPQNPIIHQGSSLNFDVKGLSDSASGQWFSANESIVSVERLSGKAEAIGEGTTLVHFESSSSSFKFHTTVTVLKGSIVSVDAPREVLTNVPFPAKGYAFSVKFSDEASENKLLSFDCAVTPPKIGFAKPWKDADTGNTHCLFFPYSPEHLARSASNTGDSPHQVLISVRASLREDLHISGSASALFIGGFTLETDKNSMHLNLTRDSNKSVITLIGNTNVELSWLDRNHLIVRPIHGGDPAIGGYEVSVRGAERIQDRLIFSLPATGQRVEVSVSYDPEERAVIKPTNLTFWAGISSLLLLLIFTITFFICYLDRPERSQPVVSGSPSIVAPVTPERSSPSIVKEQSPRTPQPFIDYVRRTIDETPYYRQDFRRRANPQNTF
ncbi:embryo defective 3012 [Perilla frutescens var. hirtella]|uniref:Embryo defective 3012 n=1 Tax=Perilla frutescens var. hirtella TaxID=608512 RepID=A0AAD4JB53_PERFH|nr:embryo defective 3012 [Perilla frutescens var. hirtella]